MLQQLTILNTGITIFCVYGFLGTLLSSGGPWGFGYLVVWIFPVIWIIWIFIDLLLKSMIKDRILLNIAGVIIIMLFLLIISP